MEAEIDFGEEENIEEGVIDLGKQAGFMSCIHIHTSYGHPSNFIQLTIT